MECKVCNDVFDDHKLRSYLRLPISDRTTSMRLQLCERVVVSAPISVTPRPTASSMKNIVIKCVVASETPKAYNFRVMLNPKAYGVTFPFTPSLYIWMPKTCSWRVNADYYEVVKFMAMENLNKALVTLKHKLINDYGFSASEIIKIKDVHLL